MRNTIILLGLVTLISCGKTGTLKHYYDNGQLKSVESFIADKLNDTCLYYFENGKLEKEVIYDLGNILQYTEYHENEKVFEKFSYVPDHQYDFIYERFSEDGYLICKIVLPRHALIGTMYDYDFMVVGMIGWENTRQLRKVTDWEWWGGKSKIDELSPLNYIKKLGSSKEYYDMRRLNPELFKDNSDLGRYPTIIDQLNIQDLIVYYDISDDKERFYYESGRIKSEKNSNNGQLIDYTLYYENRKIDSKYTSEDGIYISYHEENGVKKSTGFYRDWDDKIKDGEWKYYDVYGHLVSIDTYIDGHLNSNIEGVEY